MHETAKTGQSDGNQRVKTTGAKNPMSTTKNQGRLLYNTQQCIQAIGRNA